MDLLREFTLLMLGNHARAGLRPVQDDEQAQQIVDDWLEGVERRGTILTPGEIVKVERLVATNWSTMLERFHGNESLALIAMNNVLDASFNGAT